MRKRIALILSMIILTIGFGQAALGEQIDISISDGISIKGILPERVDALQSPILVPVEDNYQYIISNLNAFNEQAQLYFLDEQDIDTTMANFKDQADALRAEGLK